MNFKNLDKNPRKDSRAKLAYGLMGALAIAALAAAFVVGPVAQDPAYHAFSDRRTIFAIANFWNVVSNLPFLLLGVVGLWRFKRLVIMSEMRAAYMALFGGVALLGLGSGYYHLRPDNASLAWDRLPLAIALMALYAIIIAEFISARWGRRLLWPLLVFGAASVLYWRFTEQWGRGDLRAYVLVQFFPVLTIPIILSLFRPAYTGVGAYWALFAAYLVAKVFEHFDYALHAALGFSGHPLKHIAAAVGLYILLRAYRRRTVNRGFLSNSIKTEE